MRKENIPRMDKHGKPFKSGETMDRLSRFYRAKKEGDLPIAINPPVEFYVRQEDEGTSLSHNISNDTPQCKDCGNNCEDCESKKDTEWILELSSHTQSNTYTIPALVNALQPTSRTEQVTDHPFHLEAEAFPPGSDASATSLEHATTERGNVEQTSPKTSEREKANRERGRSRTAQVFLDSGCLTGSYIREEVARRLANARSSCFTPYVTKVCGAFGGCELSTRIITVEIEILNKGVNKKFETNLKVVKHLPYEIMIGRQDMLAHELSINIGQPSGTIHPQVAPNEGEKRDERDS
jgi:hypothetical protein